MEKEIDPRMHTAEHILNQTMVRMFGCGRCFSAHIEKKKSKCDYRFDRPLLDEERQEIEKTVNNIVAGDFPVTEEYWTREEAASRFSLDRLPQGAGEEIRIVKVGDYDACPCSGPHVRSTGQLGAFRLISSSFDNGVLRIRYRLS
jgi:misacylated tRNA(Ala) deacylase